MKDEVMKFIQEYPQFTQFMLKQIPVASADARYSPAATPEELGLTPKDSDALVLNSVTMIAKTKTLKVAVEANRSIRKGEVN